MYEYVPSSQVMQGMAELYFPSVYACSKKTQALQFVAKDVWFYI
jgi:hypothetical protein